jgi:xanthine dehydrogenase YagS FAD-binding subunit
MRQFELYDATSVDEAIQLLTQHGPTAKLVAGGSDLVTGLMKDNVDGPGMPYPTVLIDVTTVPEMHGISTSGGLRIGSTTTLTEIVESADVKNGWQIVSDSAFSVASPLIRNFGTLGGNLNQKPRCWFLRGANFPCYKKGGDFCFAVTGDNRYHAIIGGELCYIIHPSDTAVALLALDASAEIAGPGGRQTVAFDDYFIGPRTDVLRENILEHGDVLVNVQVPELASGTKMAWIKLKDRQVYDFAVTSVAVVANIVDGIWEAGRIVLGGVAPVPWRATVVEDALVGKDVNSAVKTAAALIRNESRPLSNNQHKVNIAIGLTERAILQAASS